ncbi:MAG: hypothetical protein Q4G25_12575 [Paracoccus sp. (in: a-proteobacteria)]|nr:hypothetical protein [Paracoccus sp. (in: a-proteobacteria)]
MTRILVIVPFALNKAGIRNREAQSDHVLLPGDWQLTYRPVTCGPQSFMSPHDWGLMDLASLRLDAQPQTKSSMLCASTRCQTGAWRCCVRSCRSP